MSLLVVGCGYVGMRLLTRLREQGVEAMGVRRSSRPETFLLEADICDEGSLSVLPEGVDTLVYAVSPDERSDEAYRRAYPLGLRNLRDRYPSARVIFVSSTAVYAQGGDELVDDESPAQAQTFSALRLREAEQIALAEGTTSTPSLHSAVLRCSGIYGPGRTRLISRLLHHDLDPASAELYSNRIHRDDLVEAILFLLSGRHQGTFICSDREPARMKTLQTFVRGLPEAYEKLPETEAPSSSSRRQSRRIFPRRLEALGFRHHFPSFREGYRAILGQSQ